MLLRVLLSCVILVSAGCGQAIDATVHDATITAAVQTALLNDPGIDGTAIEVRTRAGIVYLAGGRLQPMEKRRVWCRSRVR